MDFLSVFSRFPKRGQQHHKEYRTRYQPRNGIRPANNAKHREGKEYRLEANDAQRLPLGFYTSPSLYTLSCSMSTAFPTFPCIIL